MQVPVPPQSLYVDVEPLVLEFHSRLLPNTISYGDLMVPSREILLTSRATVGRLTAHFGVPFLCCHMDISLITVLSACSMNSWLPGRPYMFLKPYICSSCFRTSMSSIMPFDCNT